MIARNDDTLLYLLHIKKKLGFHPSRFIGALETALLLLG
jgi:hypothetical protein